MNENAERINGWAAMIGVIAANGPGGGLMQPAYVPTP